MSELRKDMELLRERMIRDLEIPREFLDSPAPSTVQLMLKWQEEDRKALETVAKGVIRKIARRRLLGVLVHHAAGGGRK